MLLLLSYMTLIPGSLGTIVVTLVTVRPVAAVNSVLVVALDLDWLIEEALVAHVVGGLASNTVPVLDTAVGVSIPTVRLVGTV